MTELELPGLRGGHPSSFLAALGLLALSRKQQQGMRLSWSLRNGEPVAVFSASGLLDLDDVLVIVEREVQESTGLPGWKRSGVATAPAKVSPREFRRLAEESSEGPVTQMGSVHAWLAALGSDLRLASTGSVAASALFNLSGNQRLGGVVTNLQARLSRTVRKEVRLDVDQVREVLLGRWRYVNGTNSLGFDGAGRKLGAFDGATGATSAVPTLAWLSFHALPLLPTFGTMTTGVVRSGRTDSLVWPIWRQPLGVHAVRVLIGHADVASAALRSASDSPTSSKPEQLDRLGVWRVYASRKESYGQGYGVFHLPTELAPAAFEGA